MKSGVTRQESSSPSRPRRALAGLALIAFAMLVGGCVKGVQPVDDASLENGQAWVPRPVSMRIYPSTQFVAEGELFLLEARIELFDAMGDSVKGAGDVRCELFASSGRGDGALGERLYAWDIPLLSLADQRAYFDPITRGYLFRLKLDNMNPAQQATTLRVAFTPVGGARMSDEVEIVGRGAG